MIEDWRYDDAEPHFIAALDKWSEPRRPAHVFIIKKDWVLIEEWLVGNCTEDQFDSIARFNSGDPFLSVQIFDKELAMQFLLRWS